MINTLIENRQKQEKIEQKDRKVSDARSSGRKMNKYVRLMSSRSRVISPI